MDNHAIARILGEIADLLEIKGDNPFKIRAYRNGADIVSNHPHDMASLDARGLQEIPGIGKDLAARIREIVETGDAAFHRELLAEFPPTILELMGLQGVGPKTVATLYRELGVRTLDDLDQAARDGRVRALKGMGPKKESLILKAIDERRQHGGRHLLAETHDAAAACVQYLLAHVPSAQIEAVGSLRRGQDTCGDIDILVTGVPADSTLMDHFIAYGLVERVLGHGDTKSSIKIRGGFQIDLRIVAPESRGAAMQYFTGSKAHNIVLRDRAISRGLKLNEYGLFRVDDEQSVAGATEEGIYEALGLAWIPPELREGRGEVEAAEARSLPCLIEHADLRGDLHMHTTETDGRATIVEMAQAARACGLEYVAITDHSRNLAMANGLDEQRALAHAARVRAEDGRHGVRLLAGIECDILADGSMDLADDCLAQLDIVIASVHSAFTQDRQQMTDRILRAIENPHVDVIGHPTGRLLLKRSPYALDIEAIIEAAARHGVALEINSQLDRLDLNDTQARLARDRGVPHHHLERCALTAGADLDAVGCHASAPRLALEGRRVEHASVRRVPFAPSQTSPMTQLKMLSVDDTLAEIRRLYFKASRQSIQQDLARAVDLLKSIPNEDDRERATVYMEGLAEMQRDWQKTSARQKTTPRRPDSKNASAGKQGGPDGQGGQGGPDGSGKRSKQGRQGGQGGRGGSDKQG
ncbi:MAG: DNA polymerase/3'-5' exonuclease PolX [Vicinamibacterales bacterium]